MQLSYNNIVFRKKRKLSYSVIVFQNNYVRKNLIALLKKVYLKAVPGANANQLNYQTIPVIEGNNYDAAAIHVGINKSVNDIWRDIISIALRCRSNNISNVFISFLASLTVPKLTRF